MAILRIPPELRFNVSADAFEESDLLVNTDNVAQAFSVTYGADAPEQAPLKVYFHFVNDREANFFSPNAPRVTDILGGV